MAYGVWWWGITEQGQMMRSSVLSRWLGCAGLMMGLVGSGWVTSRVQAAEPPSKGAGREAATQEMADDLEVTGRVLDEQGQPVKGARLWLATEVHSSLTGGRSKVIGRTESGDDGKFLLGLLKEFREPQQNRPKYGRVWIWKAGYELKIARDEDVRVASATDFTLRSAPVTQFSVHLADGSPATDVVVKPLSIDPGNSYFPSSYVVPDEIAELIQQRVGSDGRVQLRGISPSHTLSVECSHRDLGRQIHDMYYSPSRELKLQPAGSLEGRFTLPEGAKADLTQLKIWLRTVKRSAVPGAGHWLGIAEVSPDATGLFRIPAVLAGEAYPLNVIAPPDFPFGLGESPKKLVVIAGKVNTIELPLKGAVLFSNQVRELKSKQPLSGVRVMIGANQMGTTTVTDEHGKFTAWVVPDVAYRIRCECGMDYVFRFSDMDDHDKAVILAGAKAVGVRPIELWRSRQVTGFVVSSTGERMRDTFVGYDWPEPLTNGRWSVSEGMEEAGRGSTQTNSKGMFRVWGAWDEEITLNVFRAGFRQAPPVKVGPKQRGLVYIKAQPAETSAIQGVVVDEQKHGLPNTWLEIWFRKKPDPDKPDDPRSWNSYYVQTNAEGRYETPAYFPRTFEYQVRLGNVRSTLKAEPTPWRGLSAAKETFPDLVVKPPQPKAAKTELDVDGKFPLKQQRGDPLGPRDRRARDRLSLIAVPAK